jgi:hypothetical protein
MARRTTVKMGAIAALVVAGALASAPVARGASSSTDEACPLPTFGPGASYHPQIDPDDFSAHVNNPWFPLPPGTTYRYVGVKDGERAVDLVTPSAKTRVVDGVTTRIVEDRLYLGGRLEERTADYYAQDEWYFGEDTAELDAHGHVVDTSGSFHAGVDGAEPGVFMQAHPELGRRFRQEWYRGEAEDTFSAVDRQASVSVPYGHFDHALRTRETTALEPGVVDAKFYVRGVGEVVEQAVKGPEEELRLVEVEHP